MKKQANVSIKEMSKNCESVAQILKALAHPDRLMLLCHLSSGEKTVGELETLCGSSQSSVSQFLKLMRLEKMVKFEKRGLYVHYRIHDEKVKKLILSLHHIFCT